MDDHVKALGLAFTIGALLGLVVVVEDEETVMETKISHEEDSVEADDGIKEEEEEEHLVNLPHHHITDPMRQQISETLLFPSSRPEVKDFRTLSDFDSCSKIKQLVFFHKGLHSRDQLKVISASMGLLTWKPGFLLISMEEVERPSPSIFLDGESKSELSSEDESNSEKESTSVDYTTVFVFRVLMFVDNALASRLGLDFGSQQRNIGFCGRVVVLSVLTLLLYPFLWAWTVTGTIWFTRAKSCVSEDDQKWGFLIWLMFSYCGLLCIACICVGKVHSLRAQQGIPSSEFGILVDMIRVPDWAFEAAGQEMRSMSQDAATYHPGLYLTPAQASPLFCSQQAVEALIQELPKFRLKAVPDDCGECLICLEEFQIGHEVRGLPCAHNFHVECIDQWLRLNVKCPRCRSSVFPDLDLSALSNLQSSETRQPSQGNTETTEARYIRSQPQSESYLLRLQPVIYLVHTDTALESAENAGVPPVLAGGSQPRG
ncbi:hypothetical protein Bca101_020659 [Brassica carinata]